MKCSFCDEEIKRGTGHIYVKKDGKALNFCSQKCKRNQINLKRVGKKTEWTKHVTDKKIEAKEKAKGDKKEKVKTKRPMRKKSKR